MAVRTKGKCKYCGKEYTRPYMLRHLDTCPARKEKLGEEKGKKQGWFTIEITARAESAHWLIIEISEEDTLEDLDRFIRDIWVECCWHLSAFTIGYTMYEQPWLEGSSWFYTTRSMDVKLKKVLSVGLECLYEYDFGSTTELMIRVHSRRMGAAGKKDLSILSRNEPVAYTCEVCGTRPAVWVNPEAYYDDLPVFYCDECAREMFEAENEDDEEYEEDDEEYDDDDEDYDDEEEEEDFDYREYLLPVCNSPRMGVCAYEGSQIYDDEFVPDV